ncbi:hypothetical protein AAVH_27517 [Aphelenchoides avenae]|nr:hypothetical protein AAVH_27517 [Aphelenchus avenae]
MLVSATIGIVGRISGGAVGAIIGAALGYFGGRYAGDRLNECAKKFVNGVKLIPTAVRRFPESVRAKFVGMRNAVRSRLSIAPTDSKSNKSVDA